MGKWESTRGVPWEGGKVGRWESGKVGTGGEAGDRSPRRPNRLERSDSREAGSPAGEINVGAGFACGVKVGRWEGKKVRAGDRVSAAHAGRGQRSKVAKWEGGKVGRWEGGKVKRLFAEVARLSLFYLRLRSRCYRNQTDM